MISKSMVGRTENSIKNRFYSTIRKMKVGNRMSDGGMEKVVNEEDGD